MSWSIRTATGDDIDKVRECLAIAFEPYRGQYTPKAFADTVPSRRGLEVRMQEMTVLIAEDSEGRVVGTVAYGIEGEEAYLRGMAVTPEALGSGVAGQLLDEAEARLTASGCIRVTLDSTEPLRRALSFYEKRGYRHTGTVTDFFDMPLYEYARDLPAR